MNPHTNFLRGSDPHLNVNLVVSGSVYRTVEAEPDHKYPSVNGEPAEKNRNVMYGDLLEALVAICGDSELNIGRNFISRHIPTVAQNRPTKH